MKVYRKRVLFAFSSLDLSGEDEAKQAADLKKKQSRFGKRLDCYKSILKALQSIEKVGFIQKTEPFDTFFKKC